MAQSYSGAGREPRRGDLAERGDRLCLPDSVAVKVNADRKARRVEGVAPVGALLTPAEPVAVKVCAGREEAEEEGEDSEHGNSEGVGSIGLQAE